MNNIQNDYTENDKKGGRKMLRRSIAVDENLWLAVQKKASGIMSISAVIRELLRRWVNDEIDIFNDKKK